jgi:hypothetical protein
MEHCITVLVVRRRGVANEAENIFPKIDVLLSNVLKNYF